MSNAVVAGAFGLGGVMLGAALAWWRSAAEARRAAASARDEVVVALEAVCMRIVMEVRVARSLPMPSLKVRQLLFPVMLPVAMADRLRQVLMPLLSEIAVLGMRLSVTGDTELRDAAAGLVDAVALLLKAMSPRDPDYEDREADVYAALRKLQQARDAAARRRWRRKRPAIGVPATRSAA